MKLTFNNLTGRGVAKGTLTLTTSTASARVYSGMLTLILQRGPVGTTPVLGRGWLSANTYGTNGVTDGLILANVEAQFTTNMTGMSGLFGEAAWALSSGPIPMFSVETGVKYTC